MEKHSYKIPHQINQSLVWNIKYHPYLNAYDTELTPRRQSLILTPCEGCSLNSYSHTIYIQNVLSQQGLINYYFSKFFSKYSSEHKFYKIVLTLPILFLLNLFFSIRYIAYENFLILNNVTPLHNTLILFFSPDDLS